MSSELEAKIPLKTILQNFLNHVDYFETKRAEGEDNYEREFQLLKSFSDELKNKEEYSCSEGDKDVNKKKNRYKDILPYNYSRVVLSDYPGVPGSDYINANYIKGASGSNAYIACQGPLPHTVNDFWRMVVECEVQVIVMACNEQEAGKYKCECYWTEDQEKKQFGKFYISLMKSREICPDFLVRTIKLEWSSEQGKEELRTVCQFHYSAWPDHGIPTQVKPLLEMVRLIRDCQASETLPLLIHCSAGCGRTGSICAIDYVFGLLRSGKLGSDFSLFNLVKEMRRQRIAMVQTVDQYMLCHRAVKELFLEQLRVIDSHPYENVGDDGQPLVAEGDNVVPDYETIFVKGDLDIDKVLTQRQSVPRTVMGTAMLSRERSPATIQSEVEPAEPGGGGGGGNELEDSALPATLEDFVKPPPIASESQPKIHEPPKGPDNAKETAPQRFKKGNLRLLQTDDGGWKLEELEEKRRSLEAGQKTLEELEERKNGGSPGQKPPTADKRKKKSGGKTTEDGGHKESQLLRRPSMKKIKAFFDNKSSKESKESSLDDREGKENECVTDQDLSSAISKLPKLENGSTVMDNLPLSGSKSVPSSLDRKSSNLSKYWPLQNRQPSSKPQHEGVKPDLPLKRSKSMKSATKPVSVIPVIRSDETSFTEYRYESSSPPAYDTYPKYKKTSEEIIDLRKHPTEDPSDCRSAYGDRKFHFGERDRHNSDRCGEVEDDTVQEYADPTILERESVRNQLKEFVNSRQKFSSSQSISASSPQLSASFKKSSLEHHYPSGQQQQQNAGTGGLVRHPSGEDGESRYRGSDESGLNNNQFYRQRQGSGESADHLHQRQGSGGGVGGGEYRGGGEWDSFQKYQHRRQGSQEDSHSFHARQASEEDGYGKRQEKDVFLELQMAKLLARKGIDEMDSGSVGAADSLRSGGQNLTRSVSGDIYARGRPPNLLDDDTKQMLRDCQEYLQGHGHAGQQQQQLQHDVCQPPGQQLEPDLVSRSASADHSPVSGAGRPVRSVQSSPGNSFNKYNLSHSRSNSGPLGGSPSGSLYQGLGSPQGTVTKSLSSPGSQVSPSTNISRENSGPGMYPTPDQMDPGNLPTDPSDLSQHHYENVERGKYCQVTVDAREKISAAVKLRNRERRNSFRQAVDRVDRFGRPYEQIWFSGEEEPGVNGDSPRSNNDADGDVSRSGSGAHNIDTRLLSNGPPVYANASKLTSQTKPDDRSGGGSRKPTTLADFRADSASNNNIRSGSYDNLRLGGVGPSVLESGGDTVAYGNIPFTVEEISEAQRRNRASDDTVETGYEPVNFHLGSGSGSANSSKKNSVDLRGGQESRTGLASAVLVAEACRDYDLSNQADLTRQPELSQQTQTQQKGPKPSLPNKPSLQKQNSSGNIRMPPPYQAPPPGPAPGGGGGYSGAATSSGGGGFSAPSNASGGYHPNYVNPVGRKTEVEGTPVRQTSSSAPSPARFNSRSAGKQSFPAQSYKVPAKSSPPVYSVNASSTSLYSLSAGNPGFLSSQTIPDVRSPTNPEGNFHATHNTSGGSQSGGYSTNQGSYSGNSSGITRRQHRETIRSVRDDSDLPARTRDEHSHVRHMKRNSSLVTMARMGLAAGQQEFIPAPGLILKGDNVPRSNPSLIVQGSRTAVHVGGGPVTPPSGAGATPPGVDIDRVAAMMSSSEKDFPAPLPLSQMAATQGRQLGRSLAGVISGAAANLKSRLVGMADSRTQVRASPSPPLRRDESDQTLDASGGRTPLVPTQQLGFPVRIKTKPQGPRDTPQSFHKKQEYL